MISRRLLKQRWAFRDALCELCAFAPWRETCPPGLVLAKARRRKVRKDSSWFSDSHDVDQCSCEEDYVNAYISIHFIRSYVVSIWGSVRDGAADRAAVE